MHDRRVAEERLDLLRVCALRDEERRAGVPQIVEPLAREAGLFQDGAKLRVGPRSGVGRPQSRGEDEALLLPLRPGGKKVLDLPLPVGLQGRDDDARRGEVAAALLGLRIDERALPVDPAERAPDSEGPLVEIQVVPPERDDLALAQAA